MDEKKISEDIFENITSNIFIKENIDDLSYSALIFEAVTDNLRIKQEILGSIEQVINNETILITTSTIFSVSSIARILNDKSRILGVIFPLPYNKFNAVEVISSISTKDSVKADIIKFLESCSFIPICSKDMPGYIINRIMSICFNEALRIFEEGFADFSLIDWAMKKYGDMEFGPFEILDIIGLDKNYKFQEQIFKSLNWDPKYSPSIIQLRYIEENRIGLTAGKGFYDYETGFVISDPNENQMLGQKIYYRIVSCMINCAFDLLLFNVAEKNVIDEAIKYGTFMKKGIFEIFNDIGHHEVLSLMESLYQEYNEDRYRVNPLLRKSVRKF